MRLEVIDIEDATTQWIFIAQGALDFIAKPIVEIDRLNSPVRSLSWVSAILFINPHTRR
jgi:hypothetical protein